MATRKPGEWWDKSWSVVTGCTPAGAGCAKCWARSLIGRFGATAHGLELAPYDGNPVDYSPNYVPAPFSTVLCHPERLDEPLLRRKPTTYATSLLGDLFHEQVPDAFVQDVLSVAYAGAVLGNKGHRFVLLTKRPERAARLLGSLSGAILCALADRYVAMDDEDTCFSEYRQHQEGWPTPNVILMASVWDQPSADAACAALSQLRGVRWGLHCEPLLGPIQLPRAQDMPGGPATVRASWIVAGGENGPGARPCHPDWVRSLRDQCTAADVPFWFKAAGSWLDRERDRAECFDVDNAGRLLDGREWNEVPW